MYWIDEVTETCRALSLDSVRGPWDTPWNTRDVEVTTPEKMRVICTGAKPFEPESQQARDLEAVGIDGPGINTRENWEHA